MDNSKIETLPNNMHQRIGIIGKLLLEMGKLGPNDIQKIVNLQQEVGLKFGDAGKRLGLINDDDVKRALSLQFDYPYLSDHSKFNAELVAAYQPFSAQVEALRALRSQLILRWFSEGNKSLSIVSANTGEGKSYLSANLAVVFSQLGQRTLLIDANLRSPKQHQMFSLKEKLGLSDILAMRCGLEVVTKIESFLDLSVLGAGTVPPNPQELLGGNRFTQLVLEFSNKYDVIIVDTAPAAENSDAQLVSARTQGALLLSKVNFTRINDIENVSEQLKAAGVEVVAALMNEF